MALILTNLFLIIGLTLRVDFAVSDVPAAVYFAPQLQLHVLQRALHTGRKRAAEARHAGVACYAHIKKSLLQFPPECTRLWTSVTGISPLNPNGPLPHQSSKTPPGPYQWQVCLGLSRKLAPSTLPRCFTAIILLISRPVYSRSSVPRPKSIPLIPLPTKKPEGVLVRAAEYGPSEFSTALAFE